MATWRSTEFTEILTRQLGISPTMSRSCEETRVTRTYDVDWADLDQAIQDFLGYSEFAVDGVTRYIKRVTPHYIDKFKDEDDKPYLYATQISNIQGYGLPTTATSDFTNATSSGATAPVTMWTDDPSGGWPDYDSARLTILYQSLPFDVLEDDDPDMVDPETGAPLESNLLRYMTFNGRADGRYISCPTGQLMYAAGPQKGQPIPVGLGKIEPNWDFEIVHEQVPLNCVPFQLINTKMNQGGGIDTSLGTVNAAPFRGYAVGHVLYVSCGFDSYNGQRGATGIRQRRVSHRFKILTLSRHNEIIGRTGPIPPATTPATWGYVEVSSDGMPHPDTDSGVHIFDASDFTQLFVPPDSTVMPTP